MVYFFQFGPDGPIKIGVANDPFARLKQLQTGSPAPLKLLAVMSGGSEKEREIHAKFAEFRTNGEWFEPVLEIFSFINSLVPDNSLEIVECPICGLSYLPNLPEDLAAHTQSHEAIMRGAMPMFLREILKEQGWILVRDINSNNSNSIMNGKRAIAFAWWARARDAGLPDAEFEDYMLTCIALVDAMLNRDNVKQEEMNMFGKTKWSEYW